jgi:DNA-binding response OmpR family regulator
MRNRRETHPSLRARLNFVERRMERTRDQLERQVDRALTPLDIQEDTGISNIRGDVLIVSRDSEIQDKVEYQVRGDGFRCDIAHNSDEAIGFLKLATYRLVILDRTRRRWGLRVIEQIRRYLPHIKVISIVNDAQRARESMLTGGYSFLMGADFDPQQLSTCLTSSLQMNHRVCYLLANGEPCNRSCVDNYESADDLDNLELANLDYIAPDPLQTEEREADFFEELQEIETHRTPLEDVEDDPG